MLSRLRGLEFRNEVLAVVALLALVQLFPRRPPLGVYVLGAAGAAELTLHAVAVVLAFRASGFVNFAQLPLAATAGGLFIALVQGQFLLDSARSVCGCIAREPGPLARHVNFVVAAVVVVAAVAAVAWAGYVLLLRRFRRSPRIMLTLVTLFAGQALAGAGGRLQQALLPGANDAETLRVVMERSTQPPGNFLWRVGSLASLRLREVLLLLAAAAAIAGLTAFLRYSRTGIAVRAAAADATRAQTLGVDVQAVTGRVWLLIGLLAGVTGVLSAFGGRIIGAADAVAIPATTLGLVLAAAVLARFRSLPMVAVGTLALGILSAATQYSFSSVAPLDAGLVFLVGGLLLLQRRRESRSERETVEYEVAQEARAVPPQLRSLPQVVAWRRTVLGTVAVVLAGLPWALSTSATDLATVHAIFAIVGLSLLILTGWAGQVSLGQFGFAAIGAWAAAVSQLPFPLALLLGGAVGAVASVAVGVPALKLRGLNLAISTLAFAVSAKVLFLDDRYFGKLLPDHLERPSVLGMDLDDSRVFYYFCLAVVAACCAAVIGLRRSRLGRVLIGLRANEAAAQSFGISVLRARLTGFAVAGFLAAFAGALFAFHQHQVTPDSYGAEASIVAFMYAVIGGLGTVLGPLLGFAYLGVLSIFGENPLIRYTGAGTGALLLLLVAPGGLAQLVYDMRDSALRRIAVRLRIPVPSLMGERKAAGALDRARLEEQRGRGAVPDATALLYKPDRQWALDRYGRVGATGERVGTQAVAGG